MVGFLDSKGIRNTKSQQMVTAYVYAGSAITTSGQAVVLGLSANGDLVAWPTQISGGTLAVRDGRWGISVDAVASTEAGRFVVAGAAKTGGMTSGTYIVALSANGSVTASCTVASYNTGSINVLGYYSSALFDTSGGIMIW